MGRKIYSLQGSSASFPSHDDFGWFKYVSDEDFQRLWVQGMLREYNGQYYQDERASAPGAAPNPAAGSAVGGAGYSAPNAGYAPHGAPPQYAQPQYTRGPAAFSAGSSDIGFLGKIYADPGKTLRIMAPIVFILGLILSLILAINLGRTVSIDYLWGGSSSQFDFGRFLLIFLTGGVTSYLTGLSIAAFGEIVTNTRGIKENTKK